MQSSCSVQTLEIIKAMHELTNTFAYNHDDQIPLISSSYHYALYERLALKPSPQPDQPPGWVFESVRLAALIYTHAIIYRTSFATAANTPSQSSSLGTTTLLRAMLNAVDHTDPINCWGNMRGVFLWVCLIGGAASWDTAPETESTVSAPPLAWVRKCFSLWAVRAVVSAGVEHADGLLEALRRGIGVRDLVDERCLARHGVRRSR